jgi:bacillithiol biosynthesis cysteine-adding enzyme BshC
MAVDIRRFPWIRRLATDYAFAFDRVAKYFAGDPASPQAWADAISRRQAHTGASDALARVIAAQQERRQAPAAARAEAAHLADPRSVIITGQQAGLFGGPLFTLLKALTTMKLAHQVQRTHAVQVVPVFWIDAEDHDWPEVSGCTVLGNDFEPRTTTLADLPGAGNLPIGRLTLTERITAAIDSLEQALPESPFRAELVDGLRRAYRPGVGMAEAFGCWLEATLGTRGLVVFDASDPAAKPIVRDIFTRELSHPGETARLADRAGQDLVAEGYHSQVTPHGGAVALFHLNDSRESIRIASGQATIGSRAIPVAKLLEEAQREPQHFSPNVLLRPIVQDSLFPAICYVAGPNELAYLGQLKGIYQHFAVPMPLMYQRATATLVDSATLRFLSKYAVSLEALQPQDESALNQLLHDQLPPTVEQAISGASGAIEERMAAVAGAVPQIDPTLEGAVQSTLARMQHDLRTLQNKVIQAAKRRDETLRRQFQRAQALTFPHGHPQEREVGFVWFLNRYGPALIDRLFEDLSLEMGRHWVLTI